MTRTLTLTLVAEAHADGELITLARVLYGSRYSLEQQEATIALFAPLLPPDVVWRLDLPFDHYPASPDPSRVRPSPRALQETAP